MQMYPGWSARDNYAQSKKKKRKREAETSNYFFYLKESFVNMTYIAKFDPTLNSYNRFYFR